MQIDTQNQVDSNRLSDLTLVRLSTNNRHRPQFRNMDLVDHQDSLRSDRKTIDGRA
jgi:hypothetical protein